MEYSKVGGFAPLFCPASTSAGAISGAEHAGAHAQRQVAWRPHEVDKWTLVIFVL